METIVSILIGVIILILAYLGISLKKDKKNKENIEDELKKKPAIDIVNNLDNSESVKSTINKGGNRFSDKIRSLLQQFGGKGIGLADIPGSIDGNRDDKSRSSQGSGDPVDSKKSNISTNNSGLKNKIGLDGNSDNDRGINNNDSIDPGNKFLKKISMFDERLLPEIKRTGCVYLVCAGIVTDIIKVDFDCDSLNKLYLEAINKKYIVDNYLTSYAGMITFLFREMGSKLKTLHIGGASEYDKSRSTDATILCYTTPFENLGGEHFKQGDKDANLIYDPAFGTYDKYCRPNGFLRFHIT